MSEVSGVVDPRPLLDERLSAIEAELRPRLEAAGRAVEEAATPTERRAARRALRSVQRAHRAAQRREGWLGRGPMAWITDRAR